MPSAYSLSPRFWPRSSTTTESDVRVAISFAIARPDHPPPAITTSTGFSRAIAAPGSSWFVTKIACHGYALLLVTVDAGGHGSGFLLPHHVSLLDRTVTRLATDLRSSDVHLVAEHDVVRD